MRRWDPLRLATGVVLGAWAGLFWFVLLADRTSLFLSSRTAWLVPSGAALLTIAALGRLASARTIGDRDPVSRREAWVLGGLALPVVLLVAMPPVTLGTYAVGKRASFVGSSIGSSVRVVSGPLDFVDVAAAQSFDDAAKALARRAGEPIVLDGIVSSHEGLPPDEFLLTRFIVTCCTADATIAQVRVVGAPPGAFEPDDWVKVRGRIYPVGREVIVAVDDVVAIPAPSDPYLTP
jgi:putative membrane protein